MPALSSVFRHATRALVAMGLCSLAACSAEADDTNAEDGTGESRDEVRQSNGAEEVVATSDTFIKTSAAAASSLAAGEKCAIRKGAKVALVSPRESGTHVVGKLASSHGGCGGKFGGGATVHVYRAHFSGWSAATPIEAASAGPVGSWSCSGAVGKTRPADGLYWLTTFGASNATSGTTCDDAEDNCIGSCTGSAIQARLCPASQATVPAVCERSIKWFVADQARFGCGARVAVKNPKNGKTVVAYVLDDGPSCFVERRVSAAVLDASPAVNAYLTGSSQHAPGEARVEVTLVSSTTPLGPK